MRVGPELMVGDEFFERRARLGRLAVDALCEAQDQDGFGLIRASNTTPVLVLRFEGHTPAALHRIEGEMLSLLRQVKPDAAIETAAH